MSTHANYVWCDYSGTPGAGTVTLSTAKASPNRAFFAAYGAAATVDVEWLNSSGVALGVERNLTYNGADPGTLTRGTFEAPSTSLVSLPAGGSVRVVATADSGRRWDSAGLSTVAASVTTADVTGVVGTMHYLDLSGLTAARNFTLPAVAAVDDRVGVYVSAGSATAGRELILRAAAGDTLNGITAAEWSRVFITGECVIMRCVVANTTWVVDSKILLPCIALMYLNAPQTGLPSGATTKLTLNDSTINTPGGMINTGSNRINVRRTARYVCTLATASNGTAITNQSARIWVNGLNRRVLGSADNIPLGGIYESFGAGDFVELYLFHSSGGNRDIYGGAGDVSTYLTVHEVI